VVCVVIVALLAAANAAAAFEYPPLVLNVVALAALLAYMSRNLAQEGRLR
jgi:hypothetical protein